MFKMLLPREDNCVGSILFLVKKLNIQVTESTVRDELKTHPDYPSLLAVSDVLNVYNIYTLTAKVSIVEFNQLVSPFLVQLKEPVNNRSVFAIVTKVGEDVVDYYDTETQRIKQVRKEKFLNEWTGIALLVDSSDSLAEENYKAKFTKEEIKKYFGIASILTIPGIAILSSLFWFTSLGWGAIHYLLYLWTSLIGLFITTLLVLHELGQSLPVMLQICATGKKINCDAVIHSDASKIAGISLSRIGAFYFAMESIVLLLSNPNDGDLLFVLSWISILTTPLIAFSLLYQWRVIKQWCTLCLYTQAVLLTQLALSCSSGWYKKISLFTIKFPVLQRISVALVFTLMIFYFLYEIYKKGKEGQQSKAELQRIKGNPTIFSLLLHQQREINEDLTGLGITIGSPTAKNKILKICNPYCNPCARSHQDIEKLLFINADVQVQIIFIASNDSNDKRAMPVRHFLAIAEKKDQEVLKQALHDWYNAPQKNYDVFLARYPHNEDLQLQNSKIDAMFRWTEEKEIHFTPTIFVNGYQLPDIYSIDDIKYFLYE